MVSRREKQRNNIVNGHSPPRDNLRFRVLRLRPPYSRAHSIVEKRSCDLRPYVAGGAGGAGGGGCSGPTSSHPNRVHPADCRRSRSSRDVTSANLSPMSSA